MFWLLAAILIASLFYFFILKPLNHWKRLGVPQDTVGNLLIESVKFFTARKSVGEIFENLHNKFPNKRYGGEYQMFQPFIIIRDPELVKQVTVKDFDSFTDHISFIPKTGDEIWHKNLFSLKGQKWRDMRATLSPSFTSSKLKTIYPLVVDCAKQFVKYFEEKEESVVVIDVKDVFARFTNDVIASAAFGITCNSLKDQDNTFYQMGKSVSDFNDIWTNMKFIILMIMPPVGALFNFTFFNPKVVKYFSEIMSENLKTREESGIKRSDMIQLLLQAKHEREETAEELEEDEDKFLNDNHDHASKTKAKKTLLTNEDIFAQAFLFFFAGFESVSSMMSFMAYELACNPDAQEKLYQEIREHQGNSENLPSYESLVKMKYLDMVISETLRMYPGAPAIERECVKPYTIQPKLEGEVPVHIKKGEAIVFAPVGIHRDPELFPNPERFDPERFSDENKSKIISGSYVPFGSGPRHCIGNRFALMEIKALFYLILASFEIVVVDKTPIPVRYAISQVSLTLEAGTSVGFKKRT